MAGPGVAEELAERLKRDGAEGDADEEGGVFRGHSGVVLSDWPIWTDFVWGGKLFFLVLVRATKKINIARIAKSFPENISSVVKVSSCFY